MTQKEYKFPGILSDDKIKNKKAVIMKSTQQQKPNLPPQPRKDESWKSILTIILLILAPVVGIILMWVITDWSKSIKWIITIVMVLINIGVIILLAVMIMIGARGARDKAADASAKTRLFISQSALEFYYAEKEKYPTTNSFDAMISEIQKVDKSFEKPQPPSPSYSYKYCSFDGTKYKLEVEQYTKSNTFILGKDNCTTGK